MVTTNSISNLKALRLIPIGEALLLISALFITALFSAQSLALSRLEATVSQNPVNERQSLVLEVIANDDVDSNKLDTGPLEQDFRVGRVSVSRSIQIANFDAIRETRWQVILLPRTSGVFTIPAFSIDGVSSQPIELEVLKAGATSTKANQWVFLKTTPSHTELWQGQPLTVSVKLYLGADLQRSVLNAPEMDGASIRQIGREDAETYEIIKGRRYRVIERNYLVVPQGVGTQTLNPTQFEGDLLIPTGRRDVFGRPQPQPVLLQEAPISIEIKPKPAGYQGRWLVADFLHLNDSLDESGEFEIGQPITRTLSLTAVGAVEESLPDFDTGQVEGFRIYPEKAERESSIQSGQLVSQLKQTMAIVPAQPGLHTLPEIRIPWWNPRLRRQQWVIIPTKTINVVGPASYPLAAPQPLSTNQPVETKVEPGYWPWVSLALVLLWLTTLWWGWRRGKTEAPAQKEIQFSRPTMAELKTACEQNDAEAVLNLLPQWASEQTGLTLSLGEVTRHFPELAKELNHLQSCRFGHQPETWSGASILSIVESIKKSNKNQKSVSLPPLNPGSTLSS